MDYLFAGIVPMRPPFARGSLRCIDSNHPTQPKACPMWLNKASPIRIAPIWMGHRAQSQIGERPMTPTDS